MTQTHDDYVDIVVTREYAGPARRMYGVYIDDDNRVRMDMTHEIVDAWALRFASASEAQLYARLLRATARSSYQLATAQIIDAEVR